MAKTQGRTARTALQVLVPLLCVLLLIRSAVIHTMYPVELKAHSVVTSTTLHIHTAREKQPAIDQLKYDIDYWLRLALQDAANNGLPIPDFCSEELGVGFLEKFQDAREAICDNTSGFRSGSTTGSSVVCHGYPRGPGLACHSRNLVVADPKGFIGPLYPVGNTGDPELFYMPAGANNTVHTDCSIHPKQLQQALNAERLPWLKAAHRRVPAAAIRDACTAGQDVVEHPVMFVSRLDPTNPYIHTKTVLQTYMSMALLSQEAGVNSTGLQVVLADRFPNGTFLQLWQKLSAPYPIKWVQNFSSTATKAHQGSSSSNRRMGGSSISDLANSNGMGGSSSRGTCFKSAILASYAPSNTALLDLGRRPKMVRKACPSQLVLGMAHWQRYLFGGPASLQDLQAWDTHTGSHIDTGMPLSGHRRLKVVFASREWFNRGMDAGGGLNRWQQQRSVAGHVEVKLIKALQRAVHEYNARLCVKPIWGWWRWQDYTLGAKAPAEQVGCLPSNVSFQFEVAEFSLMEMGPDQSYVGMNTGVLVGVHGAALTNMLWMRPHRSAVVEVGPHGFGHLAAYLGNRYIHAGPDIYPDAVAEAAAEAMDWVRSRY